VLSDGTLRLLALTLLAYAPTTPPLVLIEEPENGIHAKAVETVIQSLSSVYDTQILCATHSPVVLSLLQPSQLLCFERKADGNRLAPPVRNAGMFRAVRPRPRARAWEVPVDLCAVGG
jgi:predicted ATPase